jgi:hypothetical protein
VKTYSAIIAYLQRKARENCHFKSFALCYSPDSQRKKNMSATAETISSTEARYLELCLNNGGEEGLWSLYSETYRKHLKATSSHEHAVRRTTQNMAEKFKISISESQRIYVLLRDKYQTT